MTAEAPRATVVIPCRDAAGTLGPLLAALREQTIADQLVLVVVDNDSSDGSADVASGLADVVLHEPLRGIAPARNRGASAATTPFLLGIDADCLPADREWAAHHLRSLEAGAIATAGPLVPLPTGDRWASRADRTPHPRFESGEPGYAVGGNHGIRRDVLLGLGGYPHFEADDAALGRNLLAAGHRIEWLPRAQVQHRNPPGAAAYFRQMRKVGRYAAELDGPPRTSLTWWTVRRLAGTTSAAGRLLAARQVHEATATLMRGWGQVLGAREVWLEERHRAGVVSRSVDPGA